MKITSSAFEDGRTIPAKYTCDGNSRLSPPFSFSDVPEGAQSLALIVDDPDVPKALMPDGVFDHWVLYNIPPETREIPEGGSAGTLGVNTRGEARYTGPCPPPEYEPSTHRYIFTLYALDATLALAGGALGRSPTGEATKEEVLKTLEGHVLETARLIGTYSRKK